MDALLKVEAVRKSYGPIEVLKGIDLQIAAGEVFAIIGPNGAGKTTLFKVMTGESSCDSGTISFEGKDVTAMPAHQRIGHGFGRTFQVARVFPDFTVLDNVIVTIEARCRTVGQPGFQGWLRYRPQAHVVDEAYEQLRAVGLERFADQEARYLSHGDKKRLEFVIALAGQPRILMLDEPTAGMSPSDRGEIAVLIRRIQQERALTVVMTEHDMDVVFGLAARLMVMNYGETVALGTVEEVRNDPAVREVYLGKEMYGA